MFEECCLESADSKRGVDVDCCEDGTGPWGPPEGVQCLD
jgi:hypothetical protein